MRMIQRISRWVVNFSEQKKPVKNIKNFLKSKLIQEKMSQQTLSKQELQAYDNSHRLLYAQYAPTFLLIMPACYFCINPADAYFLYSCNTLQYYASGLLCFNTFFTQEKLKYYLPFLIGVGLSNCLSGPISIASPLILGIMNLYFPFTDQKIHQIENTKHTDKVKAYMGVQALFYFLIVVILTMKGYHFISRRMMEKKLRSYELENKAFYSKEGQSQAQ